jgi:hypothetical protein
MVRLGKRDAVEDGIEPPIAASVQAMVHKSGGGRLQGCHAGVGGKLRVGRKATSRP